MKYNISMRKCASVKTLMALKDVTKEDAENIRKVWQTVTNRREAREQIDRILKTYGVEYLGQHKRNREIHSRPSSHKMGSNHGQY